MLNKLYSVRLDEFVNPEVSLLILRVFTAAFIMMHGIPKLMRILEGDFSFRDPIGIGPTASLVLVTLAETVCALLVMLGVWTRVALIPLIFTMLVVAFVVNAGEPITDRELPLFFLSTFIVLFLTGPGRYSLDFVISNKR